MKNLVLFHRLELTEMFSAMSVHLQNSFNIIHVAYSDVEVKLLKNSAIVGDIICAIKCDKHGAKYVYQLMVNGNLGIRFIR